MKYRFTAPQWLLLMLLLGLTSAEVDAKPPKVRDLADTVAANPIMTKFAAMIQASDLGTFLSSRGPFTVFVPTDSAFSRLSPEQFDALLRPENKVRLQDIILFHVVNGKRLTAKDLLLLKSTLSCQGAPLNFKTTRLGTQLVMKAKIVHSDIHCQNGLINEIDTMLMPPEASLPPLAAPPLPIAVTPVSATNAAPDNPATTNIAPADTNAASVIPVLPEASPH
jgi:uncharacterized surface protein with fasciclin (FAS1) repeats